MYWLTDGALKAPHTHCAFTFSTSSPFWQQLRAQSHTLKKQKKQPIHPQTPHLSPFPWAQSGQLLLQTQHSVVNTWWRGGPASYCCSSSCCYCCWQGYKDVRSIHTPLSLSLCCAQRMFIQAQSSQLSVDRLSTNHTQPETKQLVQNHKGQEDRKSGFVCLQVGIVYIQSK